MVHQEDSRRPLREWRIEGELNECELLLHYVYDC